MEGLLARSVKIIHGFINHSVHGRRRLYYAVDGLMSINTLSAENGNSPMLGLHCYRKTS